MLSNTSRNDHLLLPVILAPIVESFDNFLRFHQFSFLRVGGEVGEWVIGFPLFDLGEPFGSFEGLGREERKELGERFEDVSGNRYVRVDHFVDVLGLDFEVNDSSSTLSSGSSSSGSES